MRRLLLTSACLATALSASTAQAREMIDYSIAQLRALDKITARTVTFQADVGSTVRFGSLYVKVQACRKAPPIETPESAAFLQIWEEHQDKEKSAIGAFNTSQEWVFSGWMFASSPALSYMDHPIYDVWILDCLNEEKAISNEDSDELMDGEGEIEDDTHQSPDTANIPMPDETIYPTEQDQSLIDTGSQTDSDQNSDEDQNNLKQPSYDDNMLLNATDLNAKAPSILGTSPAQAPSKEQPIPQQDIDDLVTPIPLND